MTTLDEDDAAVMQKWTEDLCRARRLRSWSRPSAWSPSARRSLPSLTRNVPDSGVRRAMRKGAKHELDRTEAPITQTYEAPKLN